MGAHGDSARSVDFINLPYIIVLSIGKLSLFSVSKIIFINIKQKNKKRSFSPPYFTCYTRKVNGGDKNLILHAVLLLVWRLT